MDKVELKRCPLCGCTVKLGMDILSSIKWGTEFSSAIPNLDELDKGYYISCENRDCIFMTRSLSDKDEVIRQYNERREQ